MLTIITPMLLLLLIKPKWNFSLLFNSLLITPAIIYLFSYFLPINVNMKAGLDFLTTMLIILTLWITPLVICASQNIKLNQKAPDKFLFYYSLLALILILSFSVSHLFSFYIMFEASLIPTLLIIMKWGYQPERLQASMYLMLYTITASLPLLAGIALFSMKNHSYHMTLVIFPATHYIYLTWIMMNMAFMVKLPLFFFHLWLPKAHVEAPVAGSMVLAAVLLKLGGYGMLRMLLISPPLAPGLKFFLLALSLWGGMITSVICIRQQDMKSLIAYSSVGHMSLVMAGVLSNIQWGIWGAIAMMISHGLLSSALFASADISYNMSNSRSLLMNKGINIMLPSMSMLWFIMSAANMAAPPSCNLMAEIMLISASTFTTKLVILPVGIMSFTAAAYSLTLYTSLNHGTLNLLSNYSMKLNPRNLMLIINHLIPIVTIMFMPSLITLW